MLVDEISDNCILNSPPGQNGRHFASDIVRFIFVNEKSAFWLKISMKFVPKGAIAII